MLQQLRSLVPSRFLTLRHVIGMASLECQIQIEAMLEAEGEAGKQENCQAA